MSKYLTPDKVSSLLFVDNNEDSSTSDRYLNDDDCSDYVPSDDDNEEDIILSDPVYDSEDNNDDDDAAARDANDKKPYNTTTALFISKSGIESWAAEPMLHLTSKTSQKNIIREKSGPTRYALRTSGSFGDCFCLLFINYLVEEICKWTNKEGGDVFSNNWKNTRVVVLKK